MMSANVWRPCCRHVSRIHSRITRLWYSSTAQQDVTQKVAPPIEDIPLDKIEIPRRKKRDDLAVLKALASTVSQDFEGPSYKYIDDPATIPASNMSRRIFGLAKASGQKAAQYVLKRYPGNFAHNPAEPSIDALMPPKGPSLPDDTVQGLDERIELWMTEQAYTCYQKLSSAGVDVPENSLLDLLELMCAFNSQEPPEPVVPDERVFQGSVSANEAARNIRKTWQDSGYAEILFNEMKQPSARAYCALVRGRAKYLQVDGAHKLYCEMKDKGLKTDAQTFNAVIGLAINLKPAVVERTAFIKDILSDMNAADIQPTLETFNIALAQMSRRFHGNQDVVNKFVMATLNEMKKLGIVPSLASWASVVSIFYSTDDCGGSILYDVVEELEGQELTVNQRADMEFFSIAMAKCCANLKDNYLAAKLDRLFMDSNNPHLLGDNFKEGVYYTHLLRLMCQFEPLETIMEYYNRITPHRYVPSFRALEELFVAVELNEGYQQLPRLWTDMNVFEYTRNMNLMDKLFQIMASKKQDEELQKRFVDAAQEMLKRAGEELEDLERTDVTRRRTTLSTMNAPILGSLCTICLNADKADLAWQFLELYMSNRQKVMDVIREEPLVKFLEIYIDAKDTERALKCLQLMSDFTHVSLDKMADKVLTELKDNLSEDQKELIQGML